MVTAEEQIAFNSAIERGMSNSSNKNWSYSITSMLVIERAQLHLQQQMTNLQTYLQRYHIQLFSMKQD